VRELLRTAARRGAADAERVRERPEALAATPLADFGAGGAGEAAFRRALHAVHAPPGIFRAALPLLGPRRAGRVTSCAQRYAYWQAARRVLDDDTWRRATRGVAILMYHAFADDRREAGRFVVPARTFERQLRLLARTGRRVVPLRDVVEWRRQGRLGPAGAVVITMDDAYVDNLDVAEPLLRRFGFPATVFAVSGRTGGVADWDGAGELAGRPLLDWNGLLDLHRRGVAIGAHSATHPRLPELDREAAAEEIEGSRGRLSQELGGPVSSFAYPYGRIDDHVVKLVERAGFDCACGIVRGLNYPGTPLLELRRVPVDGRASTLRFALGLRFGDPDLLARVLARARDAVSGRIAHVLRPRVARKR
jgi:peptidoglycan/xylan/chitin deacetylase (PgdA/CDA1 family)